MNILFPSFLGEKSQDCTSSPSQAEPCWILRAISLFSWGSTLRCLNIGHKFHFCPRCLKKSLGYAPHSSLTDLIQLLGTALSSEIHAFCWEMRHLLRFTEAAEICTLCWFPCQLLGVALTAGCWAGCWGPHQLLRATHASSLFLAVLRHSMPNSSALWVKQDRRKFLSQHSKRLGMLGTPFILSFACKSNHWQMGSFLMLTSANVEERETQVKVNCSSYLFQCSYSQSCAFMGYCDFLTSS